MKIQLYLFPLLTLLLSPNLPVIAISSTLQKTEVKNSTILKKKTVRTFFQKKTQHSLEKKITRGLRKEKRNSGALSLMFSTLALISIFSSLLLIILLVLASLIIGITGKIKGKRKFTSILAITFTGFIIDLLPL
jgi:hypothetical protein